MNRAFAGKEGGTYYAKPLPIVTSPWGADVKHAVEAGSTGIFEVCGLNRRTEYATFEQVGAEPSLCDIEEGSIYPEHCRELSAL